MKPRMFCQPPSPYPGLAAAIEPSSVGQCPSLEVERKFLPLFGGDPGLEMRDHIVKAIREDVEVPAS